MSERASIGDIRRRWVAATSAQWLLRSVQLAGIFALPALVSAPVAALATGGLSLRSAMSTAFAATWLGSPVSGLVAYGWALRRRWLKVAWDSCRLSLIHI